MDRYSARITLHGQTRREREVSRHRDSVTRNAINNPSCKDVLLNGEPAQLVINYGTKPYYKEFVSLPGQAISEGDYVDWASNRWLVYEADADDEVYIEGALRQCQYTLYWQKDDGTIVSRAVYAQNASAYNNGEKGNSAITLQTNQFMVYIPFDNETCGLDNGVRINMCKTANKCRPYTLTRPDDISYTFGEKGVLNIIFTQDQYNPAEDKLVELESGESVWICNYKEPLSSSTVSPDETSIATITGGNVLKYGRKKTWTVQFSTQVSEDDFEWKIVGDYNILSEVVGNEVTLKALSDSLCGESFLLQVIMQDAVVAETEITITETL